MKKTRKRALYVLAALFAALFVLSCLAGFSACGGDGDDCADGHTVLSWTTTIDADCGNDGSRTGVCDVCGETVTETIPATGDHTWEVGETTATCTEAGKTTYTCSVCEQTKTEDEAALGHDLTTTTIDATCTTEGSITEACSRCDYEETTSIAALGHAVVGTYDSATTSWTYTCDVCEEEIDLASAKDDIASLTLEATDETSFMAAVGFTGLETIEPLIEVTTAFSLVGTGAAVNITLNADIEVEYDAYILFRGGVDWTLDLNGHSMTAPDDNDGWGTIYVGGASVDAARYGSLTVKDSSDGQIGAISGEYGVVVQGAPNSSDYKATFTLESGNIVASEFGVSTNGTDKDSTVEATRIISIKGGYVYGEVTGIYLPNGTLTVSGGVVEGGTGVEIRAGSMAVNGGTVCATSETMGFIRDNGLEFSNGPVTEGYSIAETHTENYNTLGTITITSGATLVGPVYMQNTADTQNVVEDTDPTWGNYDRVIGKRGNDDDLYYMGDVAFDGSEAAATLSDDGYTYVISGTSASMTEEQLKAYWVTDDATGLSTDYIAIAIIAGAGETVTTTTSDGTVVSTTKGGTTGKAQPIVINVTDYDEETSDFYLSVIVTETSTGALKAAYVITLGEITSSAST